MTWLISLLLIQSSRSFALQPQVDDKFISCVLNKSVLFSQKKSEGTGLPNCVATTLRAGGFLPVFAGSSTKDFYKQIIPLCFESTDKPRRGDVGVLVYHEHGTQTLAHVVLFVDSDKVFEKPSPEYKDKFRFNAWQKIKAKNSGPNLKFKTYTFKEKPGCPLGDFYQFFQQASEAEPLRRLNQAMEQRMKGQNWRGINRAEKKILKNEV